MSKQTEKLIKALAILGQKADRKLPNDVYYGRVMELGYVWTGQSWEHATTGYAVELEIRISSYNPDDVIDAADHTAAAYHKAGHTVTARPPILRESGLWQAYIRVRD